MKLFFNKFLKKAKQFSCFIWDVCVFYNLFNIFIPGAQRGAEWTNVSSQKKIK